MSSDPDVSGAGRARAGVIRLLLSASLTTTAILLGLLVLLHMFAGMVFIDSIRIDNATDRTVYVTPVGVAESGERTLLPLRRPVPMAYAVARRGDIEIKPGARIELMFDMDDVRFTDLVIARPAGAPFQVPVERASDGETGYRIVIAGELSGSELEPEVQQLLDAGTYAWRTWTIYLIETVLLVLLILQIRVRRRMVK